MRKKLYTKSLYLVLLAVLVCTSQAAHHSASHGEKMEPGFKAAKKPYNYVGVDFMKVFSGQEENYVKAESVWLKVHEKLASDGRILGWGLAKARENDLGIDYITWKHVQSQDDLNGLYDMAEIENWLGAEDFQILKSITQKSRRIKGREILALNDYTIDSIFPEPSSVAFNWNFMTPSAGNRSAYIAAEKAHIQPWQQAKVELDPRFLAWELQEVVSSKGDTPQAVLRTVDVFRNDVTQPDDERQALWQTARDAAGPLPDDLSFAQLREMQRVTFDVIFMTDRSKNAVSKLWEELEGSWTAPSEDGYRTKTISPYTERIEYFKEDGESKGRQIKPISVEIVNKTPQFTVYGNDGESLFSIPFRVKDEIWYEYSGVAFSSDRIFRYEKTSEPVLNEQSAMEKAIKNKRMALEFFNKLLTEPVALKPILHKDFAFTYMGKIPDTLLPYGVPYDMESLLANWLGHIPKLVPDGIELKTTDIIADENGVAVRQKGKAKGKYGPYNNDYSWLFKFKEGKILSVEEFNSDYLVAKSLYGRNLIPFSP